MPRLKWLRILLLAGKKLDVYYMEWSQKHRPILEFLILWGCWMLIILVSTDVYQQPERLASRALVAFVSFFIVIQLNIHYLFPHFYLKKKLILYFLMSVVVITGTILLLNLNIFPWSSWFIVPPRSAVETVSSQNTTEISWFREFVHLLIAVLGSTVIGISRFANKKENEALYLKSEKLETELKFLKSQVNPHFLFNALNNIYSLAVLKAPQTPESVMQLSEILRYMVYDSNEERVSLKNEINYIENFVDLQLLKDSRGMNVHLDLEKPCSDVHIAPLLLIPFVENAFKHSKIESLKDGFIKISLKQNKNEILFRCINSKPNGEFTKDKVGGVGLTNSRKRLELLYPDDQHDLSINETDDQFEVNLKLKLA